MIDGSVTVGPNAVLAFKREGYRKRDFSFSDTLEILGSSGIRRGLQNHLRSGLGEMKNSLCKSGYLRLVQKYCPRLSLSDLHPWPAGVREQAVSPDGTLPGSDISNSYWCAYCQQGTNAVGKPE